MRMKLYLFLLAVLTAVSCEHKELAIGDPCGPGDQPIKVVVHWEDLPEKARPMRINLFSETPGVADYGRDNVPTEGVKYIYLNDGAAYRPYCYDYNSPDVYFRNELEEEAFEAYFPGALRSTYDTYASPVTDEATYNAPTSGEFYAHAWTTSFEVIANRKEEQVIDFYPKNILRQFTYRVNGILSVENIKSARGAISGMAAAYVFHAAQSSSVRATLLFGNVRMGYDEEKKTGYLEGEFYTFAPVTPYWNWFTIELYSTANIYQHASWNVTDQVEESMIDRPKKLARDGYDILITNNPDTDIPENKPGDGGSGGGFDIGVGDWGDEVIVEL